MRVRTHALDRATELSQKHSGYRTYPRFYEGEQLRETNTHLWLKCKIYTTMARDEHIIREIAIPFVNITAIY